MIRKGFSCVMLMMVSLFCSLNVQARDELLWQRWYEAEAVYKQLQTDSALMLVQDVLREAEEQHDWLLEISANLMIGYIYMGKGMDKEALPFFSRSTTLCETGVFEKYADENTIPLAAGSLFGLADTEHNLGMNEECVRHARRAISWTMRTQNHRLHARYLPGLGGLLAKNGLAAEALPVLEEGYRDAVSLNLDADAQQAALHLKLVRDELSRQRENDSLKGDYVGDVGEDGMGESVVAENEFVHRVDTMVVESEGERGSGEQEHNVGKNGLLSFTLIMGVALAFLLYAIVQLRIRRRQQRKIERLEESSEIRYLEGREEERNRLAREIHDGVSNQLLAVQMKLEAEGLTPQTIQMLSESREQVRRVSHGLMPPAFENTSLDDVLRSYLAELNGAQGCEITYRSEPSDADWYAIGPDKALGIYRIVQEVVGNVLKHADATVMAVVMQRTDEVLTVTIADNGTKALQQERKNGIGLRTIRERADAIGGSIKVSTLGGSHLFVLDV